MPLFGFVGLVGLLGLDGGLVVVVVPLGAGAAPSVAAAGVLVFAEPHGFAEVAEAPGAVPVLEPPLVVVADEGSSPSTHEHPCWCSLHQPSLCSLQGAAVPSHDFESYSGVQPSWYAQSFSPSFE